MNSRLNQCQWPPLLEPYASALRASVAYILERYPETIGIVASGTIIRANPSASSDLDLYVIHSANFRQRVQRFFNGVAAEIFINPPMVIEQHFAEENRSGRPITAHMLATGFVVFDSSWVSWHNSFIPARRLSSSFQRLGRLPTKCLKRTDSLSVSPSHKRYRAEDLRSLRVKLLL